MSKFKEFINSMKWNDQPKRNEKVVCSDCEFYVEKTDDCEESGNIVVDHNYKERLITYKAKPADLNKDNNCIRFFEVYDGYDSI